MATTPVVIQKILEALGIVVAEFQTFVDSLLAAADISDTEQGRAIHDWIVAHATAAIDPLALAAIALGIIAEIRSGKPGCNPDHGGLA